MWGDDWAHKDANKTYGAAEKIIKALQDKMGEYNKNYNFKFSSVGKYFDDVYKESRAKNLKYDVFKGDMYTYIKDESEMWTGFMSSLPDFKRAVTGFTDFAEAVELVSGLSASEEQLKHKESIRKSQRALVEIDNIMQHHDAVTGTHSMVVDGDYIEKMDEVVDFETDERIWGSFAKDVQ